MMEDVKVYPDAVSLPPFASAKLDRVDRTSDLVVGRYKIKPEDQNSFRLKLGEPDALLNRRYEPMPGLWCMLRKDKSGLWLDVGMPAAFGRAQLAAQRVNRRTNKEIVPEYHVRALLMGFLCANGA
jgi:hypothetical protein